MSFISVIARFEGRRCHRGTETQRQNREWEMAEDYLKRWGSARLEVGLVQTHDPKPNDLWVSVPLWLLNTSFNTNKSVVCTPRHAIDCFLKTRMHVLYLGNHAVRRRDLPPRRRDAEAE